eukprot:TRINITY_DN5529_c0_g1_i2.p1 TRINITY_DN5529_c0_g1~~TRINITY_DN5529_c0_g1_i2.p1  ORF type:complete len:923 (+),score=171.48 TRINITY_DN5529_c0_g1_i2:291-3059(+)
MLQKSFMRKTRGGKVLKVVREHYLREDLVCGIENCQECNEKTINNNEENSSNNNNNKKLNTLKDTITTLLVIDTNVALHQMDALEHPLLVNVVVPKTVEEEVRHRNSKLHSRLRDSIQSPQKSFYLFDNEHHIHTFVEKLPGESPNDRNDRAIRNTAKWYSIHLPNHSVILITNDKANKQIALSDGIQAKTMEEYAQQVSSIIPELGDMLVSSEEDDQPSSTSKDVEYEEYKSKQEIEGGLKTGKYYQGIIRMKRDNYSVGSVESESLKEIRIKGSQNLNRSVHGDIVVVQIIKEEQSSTDEDAPSGKVIGIIKRNWKPYCGSIEDSSTGNRVLFVPLNKQFPKIRIRTRQVENLIGKRIVVVIDSWEKYSRFPNGHYVRTLGNSGDIAVETEVIMLQHDISYHPFTEAVLACLPSPKWIAEEDPDFKSPHRRDLRDYCIFSVDPPGCTDIDDALHIKKLPNGNYEVGVHIADVTHFVHQDTAIDKEASERSTTVYLVNRRIDMLPKLLGENLCSLRSDVDRFAFSVIWEIDQDANVVFSQYTKSTIRSKASLTYEQAQLRIDDLRQQDEISQGLRMMNILAKKIKKRRIDKGALELASTEVKFIRDQETQEPLDVEMYQLRETNSMVEEFMLLANVSVAEKIYHHFPNFAILRRHPTPPEENFKPVINAAKHLGATLNIENSKALADSLNAADIPGDPFINKLLRILTTRCMTQAQYFSSGSVAKDQFAHYGLATPIYTHFTSPIRRYADDIVHRLLACCLGIYTLSMGIDNERINRLCENINFRHKMAQYASRSSVELHTVVYFKGKVKEEDGYITRIKSNGFSVLVPKYGVETMVLLNSDNVKNDFIFDQEEHTIKSSSLGVTLGLFTKVKIEISVDPNKQELKLRCLNPPIHSQSPEQDPIKRKQEGNDKPVKRIKHS